MNDRSRFHLPAFGASRAPSGPPTVDEARASLGGRASTSPRAGELVRVSDGAFLAGVVVFASEHEHDVWIGEGRLRRVSPSLCAPIDGPIDAGLSAVAADAARYAGLGEGARVRYVDRAGRAHVGTLVEKCRYGALVEAEDARIVAVSFRRIAPL